MTFGTCKLTGAKGTFVRCHIIPKALTSPQNRGEVRVEGGEGRLPVARFDSWFDKTMVTRKGEDIFERLDTFAISELRRHKLVWSSWADHDLLCPIDSELIDNQWGAREVAFSDPKRMRLFCLSLLWRAAMTELSGFTTVTLPPERMQLLTYMLCSDCPLPLEHFPVHLVQLRTRGGWHNQTPIKLIKNFADDDGVEREIGCFRFYMDGLIIHIDDEIDDPVPWRFKDIALGESSKQLVLTMPYERSFQDDLITGHMLNAMKNERHSAIVESIFRPKK